MTTSTAMPEHTEAVRLRLAHDALVSALEAAPEVPG